MGINVRVVTASFGAAIVGIGAGVASNTGFAWWTALLVAAGATLVGIAHTGRP